jgi:hypothetical protein
LPSFSTSSTDPETDQIRYGWDWDGDGVFDLLVGQEPKGVLTFYRNVGTAREPRLTEVGPLQADGKVLEMPFEPVPAGNYSLAITDVGEMLKSAVARPG